MVQRAAGPLLQACMQGSETRQIEVEPTLDKCKHMPVRSEIYCVALRRGFCGCFSLSALSLDRVVRSDAHSLRRRNWCIPAHCM